MSTPNIFHKESDELEFMIIRLAISIAYKDELECSFCSCKEFLKFNHYTLEDDAMKLHFTCSEKHCYMDNSEHYTCYWL